MKVCSLTHMFGAYTRKTHSWVLEELEVLEHLSLSCSFSMWSLQNGGLRVTGLLTSAQGSQMCVTREGQVEATSPFTLLTSHATLNPPPFYWSTPFQRSTEVQGEETQTPISQWKGGNIDSIIQCHFVGRACEKYMRSRLWKIKSVTISN